LLLGAHGGPLGPLPQNTSQNAIFIDFHKKYIPNAILFVFLEKVHPKMRFYRVFLRYYMDFIKNTSQNSILQKKKIIHLKINFFDQFLIKSRTDGTGTGRIINRTEPTRRFHDFESNIGASLAPS